MQGELAANRSSEQPTQSVDPLPDLVTELAQLELGDVGMLAALAGHHGDQQVGQVEGTHHPVEEVALGAQLRLDPRVPGHGFLGEVHERLVVAVADGVDESPRDRPRRAKRCRCDRFARIAASDLVAEVRALQRNRRRRWEVAVEHQLEDADVLGALDEGCLQRRPYEWAFADADVGKRPNAIDRLGARRVDPGGA